MLGKGMIHTLMPNFVFGMEDARRGYWKVTSDLQERRHIDTNPGYRFKLKPRCCMHPRMTNSVLG